MLTEPMYPAGGVTADHSTLLMAGHDAVVSLGEPCPAPPAAPARSDPYRGPTLDPDPEPWRAHAVCAGVDPELWFCEFSDGYRARERAAVRICRTCPVRPQCLLAALTRNEVGTWGGMTEKQRTALSPARRERLIRELTEDIQRGRR